MHRNDRLHCPSQRTLAAFIGCFACLPVPAIGHDTVAATNDRLWPLPIKINLTSSFGEYRSGHLHAGLDVKTYGKEGVPCHAVGRGYVSRLRASPDGYGKAVYLQLDSGETVVYAHLSEFAPNLDEYLYEQQRLAERYRVDVYPEPGMFPVSAGDIIGYSGSTGAGAPHLHFEVRDEGQHPVNPLSAGWRLEDGSYPSFRGGFWIPLSTESHVEGHCRDQDFSIRRLDQRTYVSPDTLVLSGRVGIGVSVIDRLNGASGRLAPYRLELAIDGFVVSSITMESFSYDHTREVELAYDMGRVRRREGQYLLLFERRGESLWNRTFVDGGAVDTERLPRLLGEKKDSYSAVIRAIDRGGNTSILTVPFRVAEVGVGPKGSEMKTVMEAVESDEIPGCFFFEDRLCVDRRLLSEQSSRWISRKLVAGPTAGSEEGIEVEFAEANPRLDRDPVVVALDALGVGAYPLETTTNEGVVESYLLAMARDEEFAEHFLDLGIELSAGPSSLYCNSFAFVRSASLGSSLRRALRPRTDPVQLGPSSLTLRRPIEIRFALEGPIDGREAVYELDEAKGEWTFTPSEVRNDSVVAGIRSPGVYGVIVDDEPPRIGRVAVGSRKSFATKRIERQIVVPIDDELSGVDDGATEIFVDGEKQIARWDAFSKKMFILIRDENIIGTVEIVVAAMDRVGNTSSLETSVRIGKGK